MGDKNTNSVDRTNGKQNSIPSSFLWHRSLSQTVPWYRAWHANPWSVVTHWCALFLICTITLSTILSAFPEPAAAATLTIQLDDPTSQDSWIGSTENFQGSEPELALGLDAGGSHAMTLQFPLSSIPAGATISSATLSLKVTNTATNPGDVTFHLYRITSSWNEDTVGFESWPDIDTSPTYDETASTNPATGQSLSLDITRLVQDWHNGTIPNYGVEVIIENEPSVGYYFGASENGTASNRPRVVVNYSQSTPSPTPSPTPTPGGGAGSPTASPGNGSGGTTPGGSTKTPTPTPGAGLGSPTPSLLPTDGNGQPIPTLTPTPVPTSRGRTTTPGISLPMGGFLTGGAPLKAETKAALAATILSAATLGVPVANATLGLAQMLTNLPSLLAAGWSNILILFGIKKRNMPWGRVLSAVSGQPIPGALVAIYDRDKYGKLIDQAASDKNGRFGFFVSPGHYSLSVKKGGYSFPSQVLPNAYHGAVFPIGGERMVVLDLFCDPLEVVHTWRETLRRAAVRLEVVRLPMLVIGSIFTIISLITSLVPLTLLMAMAYIVLWLMEVRSRKTTRHTIQVKDQSGKALPFLVMHFNDVKTQQTVLSKATNDQGEVFVLLPGGTYSIAMTHPQTFENTQRTVPLPQGLPLRHITLQI